MSLRRNLIRFCRDGSVWPCLVGAFLPVLSGPRRRRGPLSRAIRLADAVCSPLSFCPWSFSSVLVWLSFSSAKDQLTNTSVAIKKIMKPFSTPVLSKRTYRELKLLKHIRHENVSPSPPSPSFYPCVSFSSTGSNRRSTPGKGHKSPDGDSSASGADPSVDLSTRGLYRSSRSAISSSPPSRTCTSRLPRPPTWVSPRLTRLWLPLPASRSYFVTELLGTDLHRLLTSRPLDDQFIQYFLYQMLVSRHFEARLSRTPNQAETDLFDPGSVHPPSSARTQVRALSRGHPPRSQAVQHSRQRELRPQGETATPPDARKSQACRADAVPPLFRVA